MHLVFSDNLGLFGASRSTLTICQQVTLAKSFSEMDTHSTPVGHCVHNWPYFFFLKETTPSWNLLFSLAPGDRMQKTSWERSSLGTSETLAPVSKGPTTPFCPVPHSRLPGKSSSPSCLAGTGASSPPPPRSPARPSPGPLRRKMREA